MADLNMESLQKRNERKKCDVSGWKYAELRDTINTSCDVELLTACEEEFHRRQTVYDAWRMSKSSKNNDGDSASSTHGEDTAEINQLTFESSAPPLDCQRYFRIPFMRNGQNQGWWYAHFDGQLIARQMETHPGRDATLLIAGRDDMQMCELKLNETGLTRKQGAEILKYEFEKEWSKHGGESFSVPHYEMAFVANK